MNNIPYSNTSETFITRLDSVNDMLLEKCGEPSTGLYYARYHPRRGNGQPNIGKTLQYLLIKDNINLDDLRTFIDESDEYNNNRPTILVAGTTKHKTQEILCLGFKVSDTTNDKIIFSRFVLNANSEIVTF